MTENNDLRYERQLIIDGFGVESQQKLSKSRVLVIGAGGLGSPLLYYLVAAGVGKVGLADGDVVDESNLNRQVLHATGDIGRRKTESAACKLMGLNPDIDFEIIDAFLDAPMLESYLGQFDMVVDATDHFGAKYMINDVCVRNNKPFVHAGVAAYGGQIMTYLPGKACFRCIYPDRPPQPEDKIGILGAVAGLIGSMQALEVIKFLTGQGELLVNRMIWLDSKTWIFHKFDVEKDSACLCSVGNT